MQPTDRQLRLDTEDGELIGKQYDSIFRRTSDLNEQHDISVKSIKIEDQELLPMTHRSSVAKSKPKAEAKPNTEAKPEIEAKILTCEIKEREYFKADYRAVTESK